MPPAEGDAALGRLFRFSEKTCHLHYGFATGSSGIPCEMISGAFLRAIRMPSCSIALSIALYPERKKS